MTLNYVVYDEFVITLRGALQTLCQYRDMLWAKAQGHQLGSEALWAHHIVLLVFIDVSINW